MFNYKLRFRGNYWLYAGMLVIGLIGQGLGLVSLGFSHRQFDFASCMYVALHVLLINGHE